MKKLHFRPDVSTGTLSENDAKKYFSTVGFAVFAFLFVSYGVSFLASLLLDRFAPHLLENIAIQNGLSFIVQYGIALPAAFLILKRLPKDTNPSDSMSFGSFLCGLCVAFTFMYVGNSIAELVITLLESGLGREIINPVESSAAQADLITNLVFFAILAPVVEELVFRKLICDRLLPLGEGYAVVLSAAIFGLVHGNLYQFFYAFLTGLLFSTVYVRTGRIRYTVIYHVIINFLGGVLVPWAYERLSPILTEEKLAELSEVLRVGDAAAMEALAEELSPYMLPAAIFSAYELIFSLMAMIGVFVFTRALRKIKFRSGLLPPPKKGRLANVFCNTGVALSIAAFAVIFILSLL